MSAQMPGLDSAALQRAPYWFSAFPFPPGHFMVHRVRGREAISQPYRFDVTVTASAFLGENIEQLSVGHRASLVIRLGEAPRVIPGVVESVRGDGPRVDGRHVQATFRIAPMVSLLRHQRGSRIFQDKAVHQVVDEVLGAAGIATRWALTRVYPVRDYITQYEESDLEFVQRVLAEAGIFYTFGCASSGVAPLLGALGESLGSVVADVAGLAAASSLPYPSETMVFGDDASHYPPIGHDAGGSIFEDIVEGVVAGVTAATGAVGGAGAAAVTGALAALPLGLPVKAAPALSFVHAEGLSTDRSDKVTHFVSTRRVRSDVAEYREFEPARPNTLLVSTLGDPSSLVETVAGGVSDVASFAAGQVGSVARDPLSAVGSFAVGSIAEALFGLVAQRRLETYEHHAHFLHPDRKEVEGVAARIRQRTTRKRLTARGRSGCPALAGGHRFGLEYHAIAEHNREHVVISVEHRGDVAKEATVYENSFQTVPADVTYPPSQRRRRLQATMLTAIVVGPPGEDVYTDAGGRVKVHFHWDRRAPAPDTTCWIRSMQPWAGAAFGHQFIPRIGMEVVVGFEGGDPDKPIILGALPNGTHPTPFALPANRTQSGIRTQSIPATGGYNELMFEDAATRERIYLRAERDYEEEVNHDHTAIVRRDETIRVFANRLDEVGKDASYEVRGKREEIVRGDASTHHFGSRLDVVEKALDQRVTGVRTLRLASVDRVRVGGDAEHQYDADFTTRVLGNYTVVVGKHEDPRSMTLRVEGVASISAEDVLELASNKGIALRCGETTLRIGADGIELQGGTIRVAGEKGGLEASKDGVTLTSDGVYVKLGKDALIKTDQTSLAMGSEVKIDGSKILLNSPEKATEAPPPERKPPTEIALTDEKSGQPLAKQRFTIELPDGSQRIGVTNTEGKAKLDLDKSGNIHFPDLSRVSGDQGSGDAPASEPSVPYVVQQGEHLAKIAYRFGAEPDALWNHAKNADLRARRKSKNTLAPGDIIFVPSERPPPLPLKQGEANSYRGAIPRATVTLKLDSKRKSLANQPYEIEGASGGEPIRGTTSDQGELTFDVPVHVRELTLVFVDLGLRLPLRLGDLDPIEEESGIVQRLKRLGHLASVGKTSPEELEAGLRSFQKSRGLEVTGKVDDPTRDALEAGGAPA